MNVSKNIILGIDASRNRSGGAKAHLIGILLECDPVKHNFEKVHVWAFKSLLDQLPDYPWLVKHNPAALEKSLFHQILWQAMSLAKEAKLAGCDVLFATDASSFCSFRPLVVLSQDMLSYEPGVMGFFGFGVARLRLLAILAVQNMAFRRAAGVIFLTRYAAEVIQRSCGDLSNIAYIPHGVDEEFRCSKSLVSLPRFGERPIRCVYVSSTEMYKHQWVVVEAISMLRNRGYSLTLSLIGGGQGAAQSILENTINLVDPSRSFVELIEFFPHSELPLQLSKTDIFVFASSCENMPVTLIEAMAAGLPIACSDRGPMPEVLKDGGVYFDPEDPKSIAEAIEKLVVSPELRSTIASRAKGIAHQFSWDRCANQTFSFITEICTRNLR